MNPDTNMLALQQIDIEHACGAVLDLVRVDHSSLPAANTRTAAKRTRWQQNLLSIMSKIERIRTILAAEIQTRLGLTLDSQLLAAVMFQPSTRNLFLELANRYCSQTTTPDKCEHIRTLSAVCDLSKVIALVGDAALSMAVLHHLWRPSILEVGQLTQSRADLVSNQHLAEICDTLNLYEFRIHFDPEVPTKSETEHIKGTLLEAVLGVIYIEHGFDALLSIMPRLF